MLTRHAVSPEVEEGTAGQPWGGLAQEGPFPSLIDPRFSACGLYRGLWSSDSSWGEAGPSCHDPELTGGFHLAPGPVDLLARCSPTVCALWQVPWAHGRGWGLPCWFAGGTWTVGDPHGGL